MLLSFSERLPQPLPENIFTVEDTGIESPAPDSAHQPLNTSDLSNLDVEADITETESPSLNETASVTSSGEAPMTPHTYPNWRTDLQRYYRELIVEKCSYRVRQAVANDEDIEVNFSL